VKTITNPCKRCNGTGEETDVAKMRARVETSGKEQQAIAAAIRN